MGSDKPFAAKAYFYFSLFMIAVYVGTGLMLIFVLKFLQMGSINRIGAGCALVLYGIYRTYILLRKHKSFSSTDGENGSF
jgi:hypothetical protein